MTITHIFKRLKNFLYIDGKRKILITLYAFIFIFMSITVTKVSIKCIAKLNQYIYNKNLVLKNIVIYGSNVIDDEYIKHELKYLDSKNVLQIKKEDILLKLNNIKLLDSFTFSKDLNGNLKINLTEKKPFAIWKDSFVDTNGKIIDSIFSKYHKIDIKKLVIISSEDLNNINSLTEPLSKFPEILERVRVLKQISGGRNWSLVLKNNILVKLPSVNIERAFIRLKKLQESTSIMDHPEKLQYIDLRAKDKGFIGLKQKKNTPNI